MLGINILLFVLISIFPLSAIEEMTLLHYEQGLEAYRNNQYDLAIQTFESILSKNVDSPELYYNLGNAFYRAGNIAGSIWAYESCLSLQPTY